MIFLGGLLSLFFLYELGKLLDSSVTMGNWVFVCLIVIFWFSVSSFVIGDSILTSQDHKKKNDKSFFKWLSRVHNAYYVFCMMIVGLSGFCQVFNITIHCHLFLHFAFFSVFTTSVPKKQEKDSFPKANGPLVSQGDKRIAKKRWPSTVLMISWEKHH